MCIDTECIIVYNYTRIQKEKGVTSMENRRLFMNYHNNLLQLEEHMYSLVEVEKPNLFYNMFRYDAIPKIAKI